MDLSQASLLTRVPAAGNFNGDAFLFDSEDGTVSGWRGSLGGAAETLALANSNNIYKGLTIASTGGFTYAYLANFRAGTIDVMKGLSGAPDLAGNFTDPGLPAGYAPFNVQVIGSSIYVAYALQDANKEDEQAGAGLGFLTQFDLNGNFVRRVTSGGALNAPWGLALAPASFGDLGGLLLVGNFGDGRINAYDPLSGNFVQTHAGSRRQPHFHRRPLGTAFRQRWGGGAHQQAVLHRGSRRREQRSLRLHRSGAGTGHLDAGRRRPPPGARPLPPPPPRMSRRFRWGRRFRLPGSSNSRWPVPPYCTYIVTAGCDATPPMVTCTGTLPLADPAGTIAFIWYSPSTRAGGRARVGYSGILAPDGHAATLAAIA